MYRGKLEIGLKSLAASHQSTALIRACGSQLHGAGLEAHRSRCFLASMLRFLPEEPSCELKSCRHAAKPRAAVPCGLLGRHQRTDG